MYMCIYIRLVHIQTQQYSSVHSGHREVKKHVACIVVLRVFHISIYMYAEQMYERILVIGWFQFQR